MPCLRQNTDDILPTLWPSCSPDVAVRFPLLLVSLCCCRFHRLRHRHVICWRSWLNWISALLSISTIAKMRQWQQKQNLKQTHCCRWSFAKISQLTGCWRKPQAEPETMRMHRSSHSVVCSMIDFAKRGGAKVEPLASLVSHSLVSFFTHSNYGATKFRFTALHFTSLNLSSEWEISRSSDSLVHSASELPSLLDCSQLNPV